ncbi:MAG TPA: hypothetical protein DIU35_19250 [Candidatus Latescibacteria bacterium]|nr:hypothetical protein [Gemmatimonadota bacterium]HCR19618.1 hypothetical protein [Candidatus Latescibacterota bacterium]|tara:strand:+ start:132 stop:464 length:333 start_codon:yes stop_codon:yes gene_type:complete
MAILCQEVTIGTNAQYHPSARVFLLSILLYCSLITVQVVAVQDLERASCDGIDLFLNENYAGSHALFDFLISVIPDRPEGYLGRAMAYWNESLIIEDGDRHDSEIRNFIK